MVSGGLRRDGRFFRDLSTIDSPRIRSKMYVRSNGAIIARSRDATSIIKRHAFEIGDSTNGYGTSRESINDGVIARLVLQTCTLSTVLRCVTGC